MLHPVHCIYLKYRLHYLPGLPLRLLWYRRCRPDSSLRHHSKHHGLYPEITHSSPSIWHCLPLQIRPDAAVSSACSSLDIQNTVDLADLIGNTVQFFCSMDIKGHNDGGAALLAGTHVHGSNIDLLFCKYL